MVFYPLQEIKLASLKVRTGDDIATEQQEMAAVVMATAKKTIITQVRSAEKMILFIPEIPEIPYVI